MAFFHYFNFILSLCKFAQCSAEQQRICRFPSLGTSSKKFVNYGRKFLLFFKETDSTCLDLKWFILTKNRAEWLSNRIFRSKETLKGQNLFQYSQACSRSLGLVSAIHKRCSFVFACLANQGSEINLDGLRWRMLHLPGYDDL